MPSDHSAIIVTISSNIIQKVAPPTLSNSNTNWINFKKILETELTLNTSLDTPTEINETVEHLTRSIQMAAWDSTNIKKNQLEDNSNEIKNAIEMRRTLRKIWMQSRAPQDKKKFNVAAKKVKELIRNETNSAIQVYLKNLTFTKDTTIHCGKPPGTLKTSLLKQFLR